MAITAVALSPENRTDALRRLGEEQFDILVIGAGVVGAGAALDAASRGLKVGLVEARDFASGTSSRSSKLVHGGLRYLKQLNFHLVFEALRERKLILEKLCPHLARPVEFIYPLEKPFVDRAWVGTGVGVYDVLGQAAACPATCGTCRRRRRCAPSGRASRTRSRAASPSTRASSTTLGTRWRSRAPRPSTAPRSPRAPG